MTRDVNKSILLVEDEPFIALKEKADLERYGYLVHHVNTGEKAIQVMQGGAYSIDLILMDINLGSGIDGTQAAQEILESLWVPIVFLSSHTEPEIVEKTEKITSYGYVVKNSTITVLDASIKMALKLFEANSLIRKQQNQMNQIHQIAKPISTAIHLPTLLSTILKQTIDALGASVGMIFLNNPHNQTLTWATSLGLSDEFVTEYTINPIRWNEGLTGSIAATKQSIFIPQNASLDPRISRPITKQEGLHSFLGVPILADDQVVGVMNILTRPPIELTPDDLQFCTAIGIQVGWAISNAQLFNEQVKKEERFRLLFEKADFSFSLYELILDVEDKLVDLSFLEVNRAYELTVGKSSTELYGKTLFEQFPSTEDHWLQAFQQVVDTEEPLHYKNYSVELKQKKELLIYLPQKGQLAIIDLDTAYRRDMEQALEETRTRYQQLVTQIPVGVYVFWIKVDGTMNFEYVSDRWCEMHNLGREELFNDVTIVFNQVHPDDREQFIEQNLQAAREQKPFRWEGRFLIGENNIRWRRIESTPEVFENGDTRWYGVVNDITDHKLTQSLIQQQLTEKEVLLREVNHRVKNNLANVESLLSLQLDGSYDSGIKDALTLAISRIRPMRVLYEKLLLTHGYSSVSMKLYLEDLIHSLELVFAQGKNITISQALEDLTLDAKKAISVGIIINELVTNAFKYAFLQQKDGTIHISMTAQETLVQLVVQDSGLGIDLPNLDQQTSGFGLTIVKLLVEQLQGTYLLENNHGARTIIEFPRS